MRSPTRAEYLDNDHPDVTHDVYYRALARTAGVSMHNASTQFLDRVRKAIEDGDEHLNTIPLAEWDMRANAMYPGVGGAFIEHGDSDSLCGRVCMLKRCAVDAAMEVTT